MSLCRQALVLTLVLTSKPTVKGRLFQEEIKFTSSVDGTGVRGLSTGLAPFPMVTRSLSGQRQGWKTAGEIGMNKSVVS